jgi:methionine-S-sulfoxide reductase
MSLSLLKSTQFFLDELVIVTKGGKIDIKNIYGEINIFDTMFLSVMSGNIIINDAIGLSSKLLFDGSESLLITVKKDKNSDILTFKDLLIFFFKIHDPTTLNQQGNDIGTQYRSAIFVTNNEQILLAEDLIKKIDASGVLKSKITTEVNTFNSFFSAEENHQKYLKKFPDGYSCHFIRDINLSF